MASKGAFALGLLLIILAVLCRPGHSLRCYQCPKNTMPCFNTVDCGSDSNTCMSVAAAARQNSYFQCWKRSECNFIDISRRLGESNLVYHCCDRDLCNKDLPSATAPIASGKTILLAVPLLAAIWNMCF